MLTDLEQISALRPMPGYRPSAIIPCSLPDSQALLEVTVREIEASIVDCQLKLQALNQQLEAATAANDLSGVDRARHVLRSLNSNCLKHLQVIQDRIAVRH